MLYIQHIDIGWQDESKSYIFTYTSVNKYIINI